MFFLENKLICGQENWLTDIHSFTALQWRLVSFGRRCAVHRKPTGPRSLTHSPHLFNSMTYRGASCLSLNAPSFDSSHHNHCVSWHKQTWQQQQVHENVGHIVRDEQVILPPLVQRRHPADLLLPQKVIRGHNYVNKAPLAVVIILKWLHEINIRVDCNIKKKCREVFAAAD